MWGQTKNGFRCKIARPMPMWTNPGISLQVSEPRPSGSSLCLNEHRGHVLLLNSAAAKDIQRILKKAAAQIAIADISRERHLQPVAGGSGQQQEDA